MKEYRPDYEFTINSNVVDFYQFIKVGTCSTRIGIGTKFNARPFIIKNLCIVNPVLCRILPVIFRPDFYFFQKSW